ncbi:hypothetical protein SNEBB_009674 [Seison nebaliae]|nr:hypothetical protein SNEBB_009674 [Seison nebaliae]
MVTAKNFRKKIFCVCIFSLAIAYLNYLRSIRSSKQFETSIIFELYGRIHEKFENKNNSTPHTVTIFKTKNLKTKSSQRIISHDLALEKLFNNKSYVQSLEKSFNGSLKGVRYKESITGYRNYGRCMNDLNRSADVIWPKSAIKLFKNKNVIIDLRNNCEKKRMVDESAKFLIPDYNYYMNKTQWNYRLNETHWEIMVNRSEMILFEIYDFRRTNVNDVSLEKSIIYQKNIKDDKIEVKKNSANYHEVYYNVQSTRLIKLLREKRKLFTANKNPNKHPFSVLILGIDSLSSQQMQRTLPLSFEYATKYMNFSNFKNAQVAGGNTYPNLLALIAGGMAYNITSLSSEGMTVEHNDDELLKNNNGFYDNIPIIWKLLPKYYTSLFVEDYAAIAGFNYLKKGFQFPPADIYTRPFFVKSEAHAQKHTNFLFCRYEELFYDVINSLVTILELEHKLYGTNAFDMLPMFFLSFFKKCTHDRVIVSHFIDKTLLELLKKLNNKLYLENTLLMLYGDHGSRLDAYIWSYEGTIEMGKAFIMMRLPDRFQEKFTEETKMFKNNIDRFVNVFDVHKSFLYLFHNQTKKNRNDSFIDPHKRLYYKGIIKSQPHLSNKTLNNILKLYNLRSFENRGVNFFKDQIKWNRSCEEATLTSIFCTCDYFTINARNGIFNTNLTTKNLYFVNRLMKDFPLSVFPNFAKFSNVCSDLKPKKIIDLTISEQVNDKTVNNWNLNHFILNKSLTIYFRVKVAENAMFKTTYNIDEWHIIDENESQLFNYVNRIRNNELTFINHENQTISSNENTIVHWRHNNIVYLMNRIAPSIRLDKYSLTNACLTPSQKRLEKTCICKLNHS